MLSASELTELKNARKLFMSSSSKSCQSLLPPTSTQAEVDSLLFSLSIVFSVQHSTKLSTVEPLTPLCPPLSKANKGILVESLEHSEWEQVKQLSLTDSNDDDDFVVIN
jgi:hypothetical protein